MTELGFEVELPRGKYGEKLTPLIEALTAELLMPGVLKFPAGVYQVRLEIELVASCRVCGCTENNACKGGCWWAESDLCSRCFVPKPTKSRRAR